MMDPLGITQGGVTTIFLVPGAAGMIDGEDKHPIIVGS